MTPISRGIITESLQSPPQSPRPRSRSGNGSPYFGNGLQGFSALSGSSGNGNGHAVPPGQEFNATVELIRHEHIIAARTCVRNPDLRRELEDEIEKDCEWLRSFLFAAQVIDEISPRSRDSIVGLGERMACKIMTAVLRDQGIDAEYVSLEDIVPDTSDEDGIEESPNGALDQAFYDRLSVALGERLRQCGSKVPVVTGFFGPVPGSLLRQIGRGYTDLLAALLAVGVEASELQIWKEVDGIFTADPRKVSTARLIPLISPDEAAELTYYGSEVVHPFVMEQVIRKKIPIRIKNVDNPAGGGTVIHPDPDIDITQIAEFGSDLLTGVPFRLTTSAPTSTPSSTTTSPQVSFIPYTTSPTPPSASQSLTATLGFDQPSHHDRRLPTAVTIKEHIIIINIHSNRKSVSHGFLAGIFGVLDRFGVVVDLISTSEVHVSMAIEEEGLQRKLVDRLVRELQKSGTVSTHRDMAILSLVGKQMRNMVGIAGRMFATLAQGNVNIEMISQGASEINISCVIEGRDAVKALNLIHQSCLQIKPEGARGRVGPWLF
ncbi:hypothetical protein AX16_006841 [Volvariella volvacea WC 439]|nr:hypothetical protein AX16_006841 [Volvariella volvacea WC 439]